MDDTIALLNAVGSFVIGWLTVVAEIISISGNILVRLWQVTLGQG